MNILIPFIIAMIGVVIVWRFYDPKENDFEMKGRLALTVIAIIFVLILIIDALLKKYFF